MRTKEETVTQEAETLPWMRKGWVQKRRPEAGPLDKCPVVIKEEQSARNWDGKDTIMLCTQRTGDPVCVFYFGPF